MHGEYGNECIKFKTSLNKKKMVKKTFEIQKIKYIFIIIHAYYHYWNKWNKHLNKLNRNIPGFFKLTWDTSRSKIEPGFRELIIYGNLCDYIRYVVPLFALYQQICCWADNLFEYLQNQTGIPGRIMIIIQFIAKINFQA